MAVQVNSKAAIERASKARRETEVADLYETYGLHQSDTVRFPNKPGSSTKVEGKPLYISPDGSLTCSAKGRLRAVRPERVEVKGVGPRGGIVWKPLVANADEEA